MNIWKYDALMIFTGLFIGLGAIPIFLLSVCLVVGNCEEALGIDLLISIFILIVSIIPIGVLIFTFYKRRRLYVDNSLFVFSVRGEREPRKCKICGKHPTSQKIHSKKVHHIKQNKNNYEDCGCEFCFKIKSEPGGVWILRLLDYRKTGKS